jgi:hypothetical protein
MPKGKVLHHQRVIGRIFRAAEAAHFPVEQIEFCADGTIIVKPTRPDTPGMLRRLRTMSGGGIRRSMLRTKSGLPKHSGLLRT